MEKEYEFEHQTEKNNAFSGQAIIAQRKLLKDSIHTTETDMTAYLDKAQTCFPYLACLFIIFYSYLGIHWAWSIYLPVDAESPNHWRAADDHFRRYSLSFGSVLLSIIGGVITGAIASMSVSGLLKLSKTYKQLKHRVAGLQQKMVDNAEESKKAMRDAKNRFNLLWELECIIKQSQEKYSAEFITEKNLAYYQTVLENAYVSNNEDVIEQTMSDIYELPQRLEAQWQEFCAEKVRIQKHIEMKNEYFQYLKEEGKEFFNDDSPLDILVKRHL
jgi:hypothetical protein